MMTTLTPIVYDVSSLRTVRDLPMLCELASKAFQSAATSFLRDDVLGCAKGSDGIISLHVKERVPLPTEIEFDNVGVFVRIVYRAQIDNRSCYLTHINAAYRDGMWQVVPGSDDIAYCDTDTERAMECAVRRLRSSIRSIDSSKF